MAGNQQVDVLPLIPDPNSGDVYITKSNTDYRVRTGLANGLATLDGDARVPISMLPTTLWTSANDGAGSGLDADLLDAQHGTYYLSRANHTGTQAWSTITGTPTTLAGYGITDAAPLVHTHPFSDITGTPTTVGGYGITNAVTTTGDQDVGGVKTFTDDTIHGSNVQGAARIKAISGDQVAGSGNVHYSFVGNEAMGMRRVSSNVLAFDTSGVERLKIDNTGVVTIGGNTAWHSGNLDPSGYMQTSWTITAGNGLTGGGSGAANRTLTLGTPSTITGATSNSVTTSSHTHALTLTESQLNSLLGVEIGYKNVPMTTQNGNYTFVAADSGKGRLHTNATTYNYTVPSGVFAAGDVLTVAASSTGITNLVQGAGMTLRLAGTATTGNRAVAAYGLATIFFVSSSVALVSGSGVS